MTCIFQNKIVKGPLWLDSGSIIRGFTISYNGVHDLTPLVAPGVSISSGESCVSELVLVRMKSMAQKGKSKMIQIEFLKVQHNTTQTGMPNMTNIIFIQGPSHGHDTLALL